MNRAEIRRVVDMAMADNGYSPGWYAWQGCVLRVAQVGAWGKYTEVRLPSGISRKRFMAAMEALPAEGGPRPRPAETITIAPMQLDIEAAIAARANNGLSMAWPAAHRQSA